MADIKRTTNYGKLVNTSSGLVLSFMSTPTGWAETKSANYSSVSILGRAEPILVYENSGARTFTLNLLFWIADTEDTLGQDTEKNLKRRVNIIRSMVHPNYAGGFQPPDKYSLFFGQLWDGVPVVITDYTIAVQEELYNQENMPVIISVTLNLTEQADNDDDLSRYGDKAFVIQNGIGRGGGIK